MRRLRKRNGSCCEVTLDKIIESLDKLGIASSVPEDMEEYGMAKFRNSFES